MACHGDDWKILAPGSICNTGSESGAGEEQVGRLVDDHWTAWTVGTEPDHHADQRISVVCGRNPAFEKY